MFAEKYAIPAPIMPAPKIPTFLTLEGSTPLGRAAPALISFNWYQKVPIIFFETCPQTSAIKYRLSIRIAESISTCRPSTITLNIDSGAGNVPLVLARIIAGAIGSIFAILGCEGKPPGTL